MSSAWWRRLNFGERFWIALTGMTVTMKATLDTFLCTHNSYTEEQQEEEEAASSTPWLGASGGSRRTRRRRWKDEPSG
jgi:hypothetical protein